MRIIAQKRLCEFYQQPDYKDAENALKSWYYEAEHAHWHTPAEVKAHYGKASIVGDNRVVFNICGNKYRLVVKFHYNTGIGYIRFVGTHAQYDKIDVEKV